MEKVDKGCPMTRNGVSWCFFWYRPTRVVPDQRPLNGCVCVYRVNMIIPLHNPAGASRQTLLSCNFSFLFWYRYCSWPPKAKTLNQIFHFFIHRQPVPLSKKNVPKTLKEMQTGIFMFQAKHEKYCNMQNSYVALCCHTFKMDGQCAMVALYTQS